MKGGRDMVTGTEISGMTPNFMMSDGIGVVSPIKPKKKKIQEIGLGLRGMIYSFT